MIGYPIISDFRLNLQAKKVFQASAALYALQKGKSLQT